MARKERKYHYIYKTTCIVTNKYYIGMHSTDKLGDGYLGSGKRLWYSLKRYGKDKHIKEILEYCKNREELKKREAEIVNEQLLEEDLCMNLTIGGQNGCGDYSAEKLKDFVKAGGKVHADRMKNDIDYRDKNLKLLAEYREKNIKEGNIHIPTFKGLTHSEESKRLMSEIAKQKTGNKNSQFGTCWITRDGENKKIKKEDLATYLNEGWVKGRK